MAISGVNSLATLYAERSLNQSYANAQRAVQQASSGSSINSAADNPAGISMADEMQAADAYYAQTQTNDAITSGSLQTADGALSQVNDLLDQSDTLATAASNGILDPAQENADNLEYQSLQDEAQNIESNTDYNGSSVFAGNSAASALPGTSQSLAETSLSSPSDAQSALTAINNAVSSVSQAEGSYGTQINSLTASSSVASTEETNTDAALNAIQGTNYAQNAYELSRDKYLFEAGVSVMV